MAVQYITFLLHKICSFPYSIIAIFLSSRLPKLTLRLLCTLCREPSKHLKSQMSIVASINSNNRKFTWTRMSVAAYSTRNGAPIRGEECLLHRFAQTPFYSQPFHSRPRQLPCVRHAMTMPTYLPLLHSFC